MISPLFTTIVLLSVFIWICTTNKNVPELISEGKFREDLFYRLNTVPIHVPALRERKDDIILLFTKFAADFAEKYHFPQISLTEEAEHALVNYIWPGNIRQLKNVTEQMSLIEQKRLIDENTIVKYLVSPTSPQLPALLPNENAKHEQFEHEIIFKVLADMKREVAELKELVHHIIGGDIKVAELQQAYNQINDNVSSVLYDFPQEEGSISISKDNIDKSEPFQESEVIEDSRFSLEENEKDSTSLHVADTLKAGAGLSDANIAEFISKSSNNVIKDLLNFGVDFDKNENNEFSKSEQESG